jgi:hypothetical protein
LKIQDKIEPDITYRAISIVDKSFEIDFLSAGKNITNISRIGVCDIAETQDKLSMNFGHCFKKKKK